MVGMVESYNVSVAAGIILAEAQRQREAAGMYAQCRLEASSWERLFFSSGAIPECGISAGSVV